MEHVVLRPPAMLTASMAAYVGELVGVAADKARALLAGRAPRVVFSTKERARAEEVAEKLVDLGLSAAVVLGRELVEESLARRRVFALTPRGGAVVATIDGEGDVEIPRVARVAKAKGRLAFWRGGMPGALVVDPAVFDFTAFGAGRDLPLDEQVEKVARTLAALLPPGKTVDEALASVDEVPGALPVDDVVDALDVIRVFDERVASLRPLPGAPAPSSSAATQGVPPPLEHTMVVAGPGASSTMSRPPPSSSSLGAVALVKAPVVASEGRTTSGPRAPSPAPRPPSAPGAVRGPSSPHAALELAPRPRPPAQPPAPSRALQPRTTCVSCDAALPDAGPYLLISDRPWCDACAAPYVEAATATRARALLSTAKAVGFLAALGTLAVIGMQVAGLVFGGVLAVFVGGGLYWAVYVRTAGERDAVEVLRYEAGRKQRLGPPG